MHNRTLGPYLTTIHRILIPAMQTGRICLLTDALTDIAAGKFVVVLDDEDRENEGDLIIAADRVTAQAMAFMVEHTSGVICVAMEVCSGTNRIHLFLLGMQNRIFGPYVADVHNTLDLANVFSVERSATTSVPASPTG
jgi:3,4-dihydroxy-2-butanone 4-phosphate synthase